MMIENEDNTLQENPPLQSPETPKRQMRYILKPLGKHLRSGVTKNKGLKNKRLRKAEKVARRRQRGK